MLKEGMAMKILILNGPNLNLLGNREPSVYGAKSLTEVNRDIAAAAGRFGAEVEFLQSNHEGELIDAIQKAPLEFDGIVLNAGALSHYSYSLRDAIAAIDIPVAEVHISNIFAREEFRHCSVLSPVTAGQVCGFGTYGYVMAIYGLLNFAGGQNKNV
jgi:3-dehydroquinate dehydratase-2